VNAQRTHPQAMIHVHSQHPLVVMRLSRIVTQNPDWRVVDSLKGTPSGSRLDHDGLLIVDACSSFSWPVFIRGGQLGIHSTILLQPASLQNPEEELRVLLLGISGIVYASTSFEEELPRAIEAVLRGGLWVRRQVLNEYLRRRNALFDRTITSFGRLTVREEQIFCLMTRGVSNKKIGGLLGISERTVKFHISNILHKRGVRSRRALLSHQKDRLEPEVALGDSQANGMELPLP
jgi:DNA-binding CsgD family transcriptional regulator